MKDTTVKMARIYRTGQSQLWLSAGEETIAIPTGLLCLVSISFVRPPKAEDVKIKGHEQAELSLYNGASEEVARFDFGRRYAVDQGSNHAGKAIAPSMQNLIFRDCCFDHTDWSHTWLENVLFEKCSLEHVRWSGVTARNVDFVDSQGKIVRQGCSFDQTVKFRHIKAI